MQAMKTSERIKAGAKNTSAQGDILVDKPQVFFSLAK